MGALHALRWGLAGAPAVGGVAAMVGAWRGRRRPGAGRWGGLGLLATGLGLAVVALVARDRNRLVGVVALVLLAICAAVAGRGLLDPTIPTDAGDRLAGGASRA